VLLSVAAVGPGGVTAATPRVDATDLAGEGTAVDPYRIADVSGLQAMATDLDAHYVLVADVDASTASSWNGGLGFAPVGNASAPFDGTFDGGGHAIFGLTVDRPGVRAVGLFGTVGSRGTVTAVRLEGASITGGDAVGGLVGENDGAVTDSSVDGTVVGQELVGGLVGVNRGTVADASSTATVTGGFTVGGLVGLNEGGTVRASVAGGAVVGDFHVGGLVGFNRLRGTVADVAASGAVTGSSCVGGLVGTSFDGEVTNAAASGDVSGTEQVGGLVGTILTTDPHTVADAAASGNVSGTEQVGGLVGANVALDASTVERSTATGTVTGTLRVGGLVGQNFAAGRGEASVVDSSATGDVTGETDVGGLVGANTADGSTGAPGVVTVTRSAAEGTVTGVTGVGGLVGHNVAGTVRRSSAAGPVAGTSMVGGLVGTNGEGSTVTESAATGTVTGDDRVGGLVGWNTASAVSASYATGDVGVSGAVGALVGTNEFGGTVTQSYATGTLTGGTPGSGLVGRPLATGAVVDSYWDTDTTGIDASRSVDGAGAGLATDEMTGVNALDGVPGFDIPETWHLTHGYPALAWEETDPFFAVDVTATTAPVGEGDVLWVTVTVTNYGRPGTETVGLYDTGFDGVLRDQVDVELDTGEAADSVRFAWVTTDGDSGRGLLTVASADDADTVVVWVLPAEVAADGLRPHLWSAALVLLATLLAVWVAAALGRRRRARRSE
jgi:hypothetical protein